MNDNLVPEPRNTVFDSVQKALGDEQAARRVMANPALAKGFPNGRPQQDADCRAGCGALLPMREA